MAQLTNRTRISILPNVAFLFVVYWLLLTKFILLEALNLHYCCISVRVPDAILRSHPYPVDPSRYACGMSEIII